MSKTTPLHFNYSDYKNHKVEYNDEVTNIAITKLLQGGQAIVSPTKVGYVILAIDSGGLEKKFELKQRPKRKPGVVLCKDNLHVETLAQTTEKIRTLYKLAQEHDILLGCILPWQNEPYQRLVPNDSKLMMSDARATSCFVIRYGFPSEEIIRKMWTGHNHLCFASSANPSGKGNRGKLEGVGDRILEGANLIIEGDEYVASQQPDV